MKAKNSILKLTKIPQKNTRCWDKVKPRLIPIHKELIIYHNSKLTSDNQNKNLTRYIFKIDMVGADRRLIENIAHYFTCIPFIHTLGKPGIFGYEEDVELCSHYLNLIYYSIKRTVKAKLEIHNKKAKAERDKKRAGRNYKKMLHGKTYSSKIRKSLLVDYHNIYKILLDDLYKNHRETYNLNISRIKHIKECFLTTTTKS